jgi:hypothetical protein
LYDLQLIIIAGFKSAGIMENVTAVICEDELVLDIVPATLQAGTSQSAGIGTKKISCHTSIVGLSSTC